MKMSDCSVQYDEDSLDKYVPALGSVTIVSRGRCNYRAGMERYLEQSVPATLFPPSHRVFGISTPY